MKGEVVTLTATIATNLRQGDLETEEDGTKGDLTKTETNDVSTSVLSVKMNEIQTSVGESSFGSGRDCSDFQCGGNSNKRLRKHWYSEEVEGYRSHRLPPCGGVVRAPEEQGRATQEQNVAVKVISTIEKGRPSVWFQLALCSVGWLATQESVVLVPDHTVFALWPVLLDRGEPCDSCQDTPHEATLPG